MQEHQIERQLTEQITSIDLEKIAVALDEHEIVCEQIESLKLELEYKEQQLQETEQELRYTNQELSAALNPRQLTLNQAKEFAKSLLATEQPTKESLAQLISAIYGETIEPYELGNPKIASLKLNPL